MIYWKFVSQEWLWIWCTTHSSGGYLKVILHSQSAKMLRFNRCYSILIYLVPMVHISLWLRSIVKQLLQTSFKQRNNLWIQQLFNQPTPIIWLKTSINTLMILIIDNNFLRHLKESAGLKTRHVYPWLYFS